MRAQSRPTPEQVGGDAGVAVRGRLNELALRFGLDDRQRLQLTTVLAWLAHDARSPTSVRDPRRAVDVHVADSLVALDLDVLRRSRRVLDLGAGAGFPGLPLAVALPESEVTLVESQSRKCAFIEQLIASAQVRNARVVCTRAEQWRAGIGRHDAALARALAPQPVVLEYAAPLLRLGGALVDWRGRRDREQEGVALRASAELGLRREQVVRSEPFAAARDHYLHVFVKAAATPACFPRRVGMAHKRPLG